MGEVVDLAARRQAKQEAEAAKLPTKTMESVIEASLDFIQHDWEKMAKYNRLNEFFKRSLANSIDHKSKENFMSDLNAVAKLELNFEFFPAMYSPGTRAEKQMGWVVEFKVGDVKVCTPELASEAYARCFAILLFLKTKREAINAKLFNDKE
jgi:hypothetical protein